MTGPSTVSFEAHVWRHGEHGAREDFQRMLTALIQIEYASATEVRADPGDWGIDTFVGSLADAVTIWQSKFFIDGLGDSSKRQVRESVASAMTKAAEHGYAVERWVLCVPVDLSGPERKWWDNKVKEWRKAYPAVRFDLWDASQLRRRLRSPDAARVFAEFYGPYQEWQVGGAVGPGRAAPPLAGIAVTPEYRDTLFVHQLDVAGIGSVAAQRMAYFNAELLARDVAAHGLADELDALVELDADVWSLWEERRADPASAPGAADYQGSAARLFAAVLGRLRGLPLPARLPARPVHARGVLHRIVEDARAGWVHDWDRVAAEHRAGTGPAAAAAPAAARQPEDRP